MRTRRTAPTRLVALGFVALLATAGALLASGGGSYRVWFVDSRGPRTGDLDGWIDEPPILERTFDLPWLIAAWREGVGRPLNEIERGAMADLVALRRGSAWAREETPEGESAPSPQSRWRAVRRELGLERVWTATFRTTERSLPDGTVEYLFFENCLPTAFGVAADTFAGRRERPEYDEQALRAWVAAQDQVFSNCPNIQEPTVPRPAPADAPRLVQDDRRYQIGAAQFYAGLYEEAIDTWEALAAEGGELAELARYLTGRAALRWEDVGAADGEERLRAEAAARRRLTEFAADGASASELVDSARGLLDLLDRRTDASARQRRAARAIATADYAEGDGGPADRELVRVWGGLRFLVGSHGPDPLKCVAPITDVEPLWGDDGEELLVWLACLRSPSRAALHTLTARSVDGARSLWATAALIGVSREGEVQDVGALKTLQQMTALVPELFDPGSDVPVWLRRTAAVHAARIEIEHRLFDAAHERLADVEVAHLRLDDRNRVLIERGRAAPSFDEWIDAAALEPVAEGWSDASELIWDLGEQRYPRVLRSEIVQVAGAAFGSQAVQALTRHGATPSWLRTNLMLRAWLLAALDGDDAAVDRARAVLDLEPQSLANGYDADEFQVATLAPAALADLRRWLELPVVERPWWTAWMLLQHHELGIFLADVEEGIWPQPWCAAFHLEPDLAPLQRFGDRPPLPEFEGFAPYSTGAEVMRWAADQVFARLEEALRNGSAVGDSTLPEALHLLVRRTRPSACRDGEISQRAFQALHRHYAGGEWARATPYWYE